MASRQAPVRAILVGAGQFGASLLAQARHTPELSITVICDRAVRGLQPRLEEQGLTRGAVLCESRADALSTLEAGRSVLLEDPELAVGLPADILVEATGHPVAAAGNAAQAIAAGLHVAMVSKEADITVGPALAARARSAGLVCTPVDGDQPSLLLRLIDRVRRLGLEVVAAGKSSEYDIVWPPGAETVTVRSKEYPAGGLDRLFDLGDDPLATLDHRGMLLEAVPRRGAPDFCEMGIVANGAGLGVDRPDLHAPILRPVELADAFRPEADGGLLRHDGVIDVFHALRRADEASFAGGVFVVVRGDHRPTFELLREKGHVVSRDGRYLALYQPSHLLGIEAVGTIISAVRNRQATPGCSPRPVVDLVGRATRVLEVGHPLSLAERHEIDGLVPLLLPAAPAAGSHPMPFYLAAGRRLARPLDTGTVLSADALRSTDDDPLQALRREQDQAFFG